MKNLILALLFVLSSCGGALINDPSLSVVDSNYASLEIHSKGKVSNGLSIVEFNSGQTLNDLKIKVQGYYKGELRYFSSGCGFDDSIRYDDSKLITLSSSEKLEKTCLLSIILSIDYPNQGTVVTHPFKGLIILALKKKTPTYLITKKIRQYSEFTFKVPFKEDATVFVRGCGLDEDKFYKSVDGKLLISFDKPSEVKTCSLQLAVIGQNKKLRVRALINIFNEEFSILALPQTIFVKKKLELRRTNFASIISVGNKYKIKDKYKFKYKNGDIIRQISSKGRLILGKIIKKGMIVWEI